MRRRLRLVALGTAASLASTLLIGCDNIVTPTHPNVSTEVAPPAATQATWPQVADTEPRAADVYWPSEFSATNPPSSLPAIVWIPGGWGGDENPFDPSHYTGLDFVVVALRYSRIDGAVDTPSSNDPEWPVQARDVDTAMRWIRAYHTNLGIDPSRVIIQGGSAGAHLAASLTTGDFADPDPTLPAAIRNASSRPDGLILVNGPYELSRKTDFDRFGATPDDDLAHILIKDLLECDPWDPPTDPSSTTDPDNLPLCSTTVVDSASPTKHSSAALARFPRTFIYGARNDEIVGYEQSYRFNFALCVAGVETHWNFPDTGMHGATNLGQDLLDQFLRPWNPDHIPAQTVTPPWTDFGVCNPS